MPFPFLSIMDCVKAGIWIFLD